jgi:hypothetical protein
MVETQRQEKRQRYLRWNHALIQYFTTGVSSGERIYLSVDDDTLDNIGRQFSSADAPRGAWSQVFQRAVREYIVNEGAVNLEVLRERDKRGQPRGVAFLGLCVLAASRMANEEEISEINYFTRFKEILEVNSNVPRPRGMSSGRQAEQSLWEDWNLWLVERGFQASAKAGSGPRTYINYPISQCLLRQADKDRLQTFFLEQNWSRYPSWDARSLWSNLRKFATTLSGHLRELITTNPHRYEAVAEAIHELYQQWHGGGCPEQPHSSGIDRNVVNKNLFAGLYRVEDPLLGEISYYLYPKQPRGREISDLLVEYQNERHPLIIDTQYPGWYLPIGQESLNSQDLTNSLICSIHNSSEFERLILPDRDFWILVTDPENFDSGVHASWRNPDLGTRFILLCKNREDLIQDIKRLKEERLLEFAEEPKQVNNFNWVEFHQCMIISQVWDGVFVSNPSLKDALQPTVKLSIGLSGGLRLPDRSSWLVGYLPKITIFGFSPSVTVQISDLSSSEIMISRSQMINQSYSLSITQGSYLIRVNSSGEFAEKVIRVKDWDSVDLIPVESQDFYRINNNYQLCGSVIEEIV